MEILNKVPEAVFEQLEKKGVSKETAVAKIKEFAESEEAKLFPGDEYILERLNVYYSKIMSQPDMEEFEGLVIGVSAVKDDNEFQRFMAKSKAAAGASYNNGYNKNLKEYPINTMVPCREGFFPWGFNIGEPIPEVPKFVREVIVGMKLGDTIVAKTLSYYGPWLEGSELEVGNEIKFTMLKDEKLQDNLQKDILRPRGEYVKTEAENTSEDVLTFMNENFSDKFKTGQEIMNDLPEGLVFTKGSVATLDSSFGDWDVSFKDNSVMFSMENTIKTKVSEDALNFTDTAADVTFVGKIRRDKDNKLVLDYFGSIVPEEHKRVAYVEEPSEVAEDLTEQQEADLLADVDSLDETSLLS